MGEQPSYGVAGAGADGLGGLTWDPGPQASGRNPGVSRDSQTCRWPWDPGAGWSVFLSRMFWKNIFARYPVILGT